MEQAKKVFGSGPLCFIIGFLFVGLAYKIELALNIQKIPMSAQLSHTLFWIFMLLTFLFVIWGFISLPVSKRGETLVTKGAFRYVRHPLYAGFLTFFIVGIGFYLKSYTIILSIIPLMFICGAVVSREEHYMEQLFGKKYTTYKAKTKRFIPGIY